MIKFKIYFLLSLLILALPVSGIEKNEKGKKTFVITNCITDLDEFRELVNVTARLKKYGNVQINIGVVAEKAFYEIPEGGNPWSEYASNFASIYKFFPDEKLAPYVPADFVRKNREMILAKAKILRENGMEAAFYGNEPAILPAAFFDAYPQLRGARVDHPRRSNYPFFSPCLSRVEMQDIYSDMIAGLLKNVPEVKTLFFKTNDAGSGNCWSEWLYVGANGPEFCKNETTGERIRHLMNSLQSGAEKADGKLDVYLSFPQGSSNFTDEERADIQSRLPDHCYFGSTPDNELISLGSSLSFTYPAKGIFNVLSYLESLEEIETQKPQTIFINLRSFYDRGNETPVVDDLMFALLEDHLAGFRKNDQTVSQTLHGYCVDWAGEKDAAVLNEALTELNTAGRYRHPHLNNLYGVYWGVSSRMINRPLVIAPQRLSEEEEAYFLPFIFNVSQEEARMDYIDIHGGRWKTSPDSITTYVGKILQVCKKLESIDAEAPKSDFIQQLAVALRIHASMMRSYGNFAAAQQIRDDHAAEITGPIHRPTKEPTMTGDPDLQRFNALMRNELENTEELISILEAGGDHLLCHAQDPVYEDCFLLGPDIIAQLKKKRKTMLVHWRDIEDYMTTPFK
jgi:hypothetical protein